MVNQTKSTYWPRLYLVRPFLFLLILKHKPDYLVSMARHPFTPHRGIADWPNGRDGGGYLPWKLRFF
ncbi:hypothetical protein BFP76_05845 [Amylibacter kogurei]|uniref:Uncharacterized protein n=1 Tax=Paramylibacter kogurei TaxID=1889778 RepID=A0A2G5K5M8_9RHOB|nr:hypothetical protein BFP76_05845 [Amylibacter kogurei]